MTRPSNQELAKRFRELLTKGVYFTDDEGEIHTAGDQYDAGMAATKPWRNELWRAFREIEDRLDPIGAMDRERKSKA
jgi:hypothetical protein